MFHGHLPRGTDERPRQAALQVLIDGEHDLRLRTVALDRRWDLVRDWSSARSSVSTRMPRVSASARTLSRNAGNSTRSTASGRGGATLPDGSDRRRGHLRQRNG